MPESPARTGSGAESGEAFFLTRASPGRPQMGLAAEFEGAPPIAQVLRMLPGRLHAGTGEKPPGKGGKQGTGRVGSGAEIWRRIGW